MIKIFIITFFILETVVALAIIFKLRDFDRKIILLEKEICSKQNGLRSFFFNLKTGLVNSNRTITIVKNAINRKREEIILGIIRQLVIFSGIFILKDKYKKKFLIINILFDIYSEFKKELKPELL